MEDSIKKVQDAKAVFRKCGTCSQTFAHLLNRDFGHTLENEERALDPLAGGIANQGYQCGMVWGAALAIGGESHRQNEDHDKAHHVIDITHTVRSRTDLRHQRCIGTWSVIRRQ